MKEKKGNNVLLSSSGGIATVVLAVLKLTGKADISWLMVLLPEIISVATGIIMTAVSMALMHKLYQHYPEDDVEGSMAAATLGTNAMLGPVASLLEATSYLLAILRVLGVISWPWAAIALPLLLSLLLFFGKMIMVMRKI